jgi:hypothetical protein
VWGISRLAEVIDEPSGRGVLTEGHCNSLGNADLALRLRDHFAAVGGLACAGGSGDRPRGSAQGQERGEG